MEYDSISMIRFNEYRNGAWKVSSANDYGKVAEELRKYAISQGDEFDNDDIQTLIEDYDFIVTGKSLENDLHFNNLVRELREGINGFDKHEKTLVKAFMRLIKENNLPCLPTIELEINKNHG